MIQIVELIRLTWVGKLIQPIPKPLTVWTAINSPTLLLDCLKRIIKPKARVWTANPKIIWTSQLRQLTPPPDWVRGVLTTGLILLVYLTICEAKTAMKVAAKEGIVDNRVAVLTSTPAATTTENLVSFGCVGRYKYGYSQKVLRYPLTIRPAIGCIRAMSIHPMTVWFLMRRKGMSGWGA